MLIAHMVVFGLWVGITPLGLLTEGILMSGDRPRANGLAFLAGWIGVMTAVMFLGAQALRFPSPPDAPETIVAAAITAFIGAALCIAGVRLRRRPPKDPSQRQPPSWLTRFGEVGSMGALVAGVAVPSYPPTLAAGAELARSEAAPSIRLLAALIFIACGCALVGPPVVVAFRDPERVQQTFDRLQKWIHDNWIKAISFALISLGAVLLLASTDDVFRAVL